MLLNIKIQKNSYMTEKVMKEDFELIKINTNNNYKIKTQNLLI